VGNNYSRYQNPEFDALIEKFFATIPQQARTQVASQVVRLTTDQLPVLTTFFQVGPILISNRVPPLPGDEKPGPANIHLWDIA
jgi:ABC-type transport system substrate-binding protein